MTEKTKFKIGDRVRLTSAGARGLGADAGAEAVVEAVDESPFGHLTVRWTKGANDQRAGGYAPDRFELVSRQEESDWLILYIDEFEEIDGSEEFTGTEEEALDALKKEIANGYAEKARLLRVVATAETRIDVSLAA